MTDTGVSPILFYDPVERVVATLHPNHTWEKVVFDPWQQMTYDVNDTVTRNPKTDDDVKGFFTGLPDAEYLPTWHEARKIGQQGPEEKAAADKAAFHADTPTVAHVDALARTFLTIAHNRFERNNAIVEEKYPTRLVLDIEGNQREVIDPKNRVVMRYDYDIAGPEEDEDTATNRIHQLSMEAGERWMLNDVTGKPISAWDSRKFTRRMTYDVLRRPVGLFVTENGVERLAERTVYGESQGAANNHKTRVFQVFDGAGRVTSEAYDFKGNLLRSKRELLPDYKGEVDWRQNPTPNDGTFTSSTTFDALNRATTVTAPDNSAYRPTYNEANLLDKVEVKLRGAATATPFVTNIDYNAKGQRTLIRYANGAETTYEYDDQTFRLIHLKTTRPPALNGLASQIFKNAATVQDLRYTYDPAGNITRIGDGALPMIAHGNQQVAPVCDYTYDAIYRLIEAKGREHIGRTVFNFDPPNGNFRDYPFAGLSANPNDLRALRNYTEQYDYDAVGNFEKLIHQFANGSWTRAYAYNEASLIDPATHKSNRLSTTTVSPPAETYAYDAHGNMTRMLHLGLAHPAPNMHWDYQDQLRRTDLGGGGTAYYVYDASGQRVRKVWEKSANLIEERIYLGGFEIFRRHGGAIGANTATLERETLHIMDDKRRVALVETKTKDVNVPAITLPETLTRYQLGNHLGSASVELDKDGALISYEEYHPYGTAAFQAGRSAAEVSLKRYRYTGKERDEESGLSYHGARYYAPWLGRWSSCDPLGIKGGVNVYIFARNAPTNHVDTDGLQAKKPPETTSDQEELEDLWNNEIKTKNSEGIRFMVGVNKKKVNDITNEIPQVAKQIKKDNSVLKSPASQVKTVFITPTSSQFALWKGEPVLMLDPKDANKAGTAHEMGHKIFDDLGKLAESSGKDARGAKNFRMWVADIYVRLSKIETKKGEKGLLIADPTRWGSGMSAEHPSANPDEFFASAKEAYQIDLEGFKKAIAKAIEQNSEIREPANELLDLLKQLLEKGNYHRKSCRKNEPALRMRR